MKTSKTARKHSSTVIQELLKEITPAEKLKTKTKMLLAARLSDLITARGWNKGEFAEKTNRNASEITKWLSGTHNFTVDTLAEIACVLNIPVAELLAPKHVHVINKVHIVVVGNQMPQKIQYETPISQKTGHLTQFSIGSRPESALPLTPCYNA